MLNYLKSECYKTFKRSYTRLAILIIALLCIIANAVLFIITKDSATPFFEISITALYTFLTTPIYLILIFIDIVFSDEYKNKTFKNTLSFGITRAQIFFGKLIISLLVFFIIAFVFFIVYLSSTLIFSGIPTDWSPLYISMSYFITALPVYLAALCLCNTMAFIIPNSTAFSFGYIGVLLLLTIIDFLITSSGYFMSFNIFGGINSLIPSIYDNIGQLSNMGRFFWGGVFYSIVSIIIGLMVFRKREIK